MKSCNIKQQAIALILKYLPGTLNWNSGIINRFFSKLMN